MSFASISFIIFFLVVILGTLIIQKFSSNKVKQIFLFVTIIAYYTAKFKGKKYIYAIGIITPLVVLGFFKYFNFFIDSVSNIIGADIGIFNIILPVGISFYTFQALSYVIDVHRGKIDVENDFIRLSLYLSFFPQLVAGPIVKASEFLPQLKEERKTTINNLKYGIQLMAFGLFKKIVLADHLSVFVDDVFRTPTAFHWATILLAVISYSIQIYFDFSGYSDIAIGCAKCLGYDFNRNFNLPYISQNVTEFWHRWHISLSTWLKEYLYIPLGGNRKGKFRQYLNLFITMTLGGLWHGANWTFVFWGALNGLALCFNKLFSKHKEKNIFSKCASILATFSFITFTWIFFRADNFTIAFSILKAIFTLQKGIIQPFFWSFVSIAILIIFTIGAIVKSNKNMDKEINGYYPMLNLNTVYGLSTLFIVFGLIICLAFTGEQPFVYFQF